MLVVACLTTVLPLTIWGADQNDGSQMPHKIQHKPDQMPVFRNEQYADFDAWAAATVSYPKEAIEAGISGEVLVSFVVKASGHVTEVRVTKGVHPFLDDEAMRVVRNSPDWIPARKDGKAVDSQQSLPVRFKYNEPSGQVVVTAKKNTGFLSKLKEGFLPFHIRAAFSLLAFFLIYSLFFRKDTHFRLNRSFLIFSLLFSFLTPLFPINLSFSGTLEGMQGTFATVLIPEATVYAGQAGDAGWLQNINWLLWIYLTGVFFFAGKFIFQLGRIHQLKTMNNQSIYQGYRLVEFEGNEETAFSFFRTIFIHKNLSPDDRESILAHEMQHIRHGHSHDRILFEIIAIFQWFNPIVWLNRNAIRELHEYQADARVISAGTNKLNYQNLILKHVLKVNLLQYIQPFSQPSLIKKRIVMMSKSKTPRAAGAKLLLIAPVITGLLFFFSCAKETEEEIATVVSFESKEMETLLTANPEEEQLDGQIFVIVEDMPTFRGGGVDKFREWVNQNLQYPAIASKNGIQGRVYIDFVVDKEGKVGHVKVVRGVDPSLDKAAMDVVRSAPDWEPGMQSGKPVNVRYSFPILFELK